MADLDPASANPRCFVSYSHDDEDHKRRVLELAEDLRRNGVDVRIDRYVETIPIRSWPLWMNQEIAAADFVLIVATKVYFERFNNLAGPGVGLGARWEGAVITNSLYEESGETSKFIPVVFGSKDWPFIPAPLRGATRFNVSIEAERKKLLHLLHRAPAIIPGPIGKNPFRPGGETEPHDDVSDLPPDDSVSSEDRLHELKTRLETADRASAVSIAIEIGDLRAEEDLFSESLTAYKRALELTTDAAIREEVSSKFQTVYGRMQAHFGEGGPVQAVYAWIRAVRQGEFDICWRMIEPKMRLVLAQAWITANRSRTDVAPLYADDAAAEKLSELRSDHRLAQAFRATQMREFRTSYGQIDPDLWGAAERPRRFGIDLELIILMQNNDEPFVWEPGKEAPAIAFILRWIHGTWYIASFGTDLSEPGWPPQKRPLPLQGVSFR